MPRYGYLATALVAALLPGVALAPSAVAATAVTSPADGVAITGTEPVPTMFAVSGTATVEPAVELRCGVRHGGTWHYSGALEGAENVPVVAGAWSASVRVPIAQNPCRLFAFPAGLGAPNGTVEPAPTYTGPRLRFVFVNGMHIGGPQSLILNAGLELGGTTAIAYGNSIGDVGMTTELIGPEPSAESVTVFDDANRIRTFDLDTPATSGGGTRLGLQVDGVNAYVGGSWLEAGGNSIPFWSYASLPTVSAVPSIAADGSPVITEEDTVRACTGTDPTTYPLGGFTCMDSLADPGVALRVVTTASPSGAIVRRDWALRSTDAAAHAVHLVLTQTAATNVSGPREWRVAGGAYAQRTTGETLPPQTAPFSLAVRHTGAPEPDPAEGHGALTFGVAPSELRFTGPRVLAAVYDLTVPATGTVALPFVLSTEASQAAIDADIAAIEAGMRPGTYDPPDGGDDTPPTGEQPPTDPGTTTGPVTPPTVTPPAPVLAPKLTWRGKPSLRKGKLSLAGTLACPGSGPACSATVTLTAKLTAAAKRRHAKAKVLAKATVKVQAGKSVALTLKVKQGKPALKRAKPAITVATQRGTLRLPAVKRSLKLS